MQILRGRSGYRLRVCIKADDVFQSFRHIVGGYRDEISKSKVSEACYNCSSKLNRWHMNWAYMSLVWVAFSDLYVRLCSMGVITDYRIF